MPTMPPTTPRTSSKHAHPLSLYPTHIPLLLLLSFFYFYFSMFHFASLDQFSMIPLISSHFLYLFFSHIPLPSPLTRPSLSIFLLFVFYFGFDHSCYVFTCHIILLTAAFSSRLSFFNISFSSFFFSSLYLLPTQSLTQGPLQIVFLCGQPSGLFGKIKRLRGHAAGGCFLSFLFGFLYFSGLGFFLLEVGALMGFCEGK